jgi:hypothetical protein
MDKELIINRKLLPKKTIKKKCRGILDSKNHGDLLDDNELNFLMEVIIYHPKYVSLKQKKIKKIRVFSTLLMTRKSFIVMFENGAPQNIGINKYIYIFQKTHLMSSCEIE